MNSGATMARDAVEFLDNNLNRIVRNIFPGAIVMGGAYLSHSDWFKDVDWNSANHLLILGIIAIVAGNVWMAFHRYYVHQFVDYCFYRYGKKGPNREIDGDKYKSYVDAVAHHVVKVLKSSDEKVVRVQKHVQIRAASMHLIYIVFEVIVIFAILPADLPKSIGAREYIIGAVLGIIGIYGLLAQNNITRRIDWYSYNKFKDFESEKN